MKQLRYVENIAALKYNQNKCTGCEMCVKVCPRNVFVMEGKKAKVADHGACIECGACMVNCAYGAINVETGPGCAAAILGSKGGKAECGCGDDKNTGCCG
ncbi:MAG: NADH-plastoquinone oxidoreductase subunit [Candidatus Aerophobetes bacterium ADurb.Bin490]|nr:MAG: NADH-plastoquinone oxidoreductase subunit [Candidatus Aerophobetes bacterium ADurb.Bin490]HRQ45084.1 4Fe-4S binding protein [Candidatus Goldiibacteriota bacterium]